MEYARKLALFACWFIETGFLCVQLWLSSNLLCRLGWPQTHRAPPASASQVKGMHPTANIIGWNPSNHFI